MICVCAILFKDPWMCTLNGANTLKISFSIFIIQLSFSSGSDSFFTILVHAYITLGIAVGTGTDEHIIGEAYQSNIFCTNCSTIKSSSDLNQRKACSWNCNRCNSTKCQGVEWPGTTLRCSSLKFSVALGYPILDKIGDCERICWTLMLV